MTPKTDEKTLQNSVIELLKNMGYIYIPPEDMPKYRANTKEVVLKDILYKRLNKLNSYEYKGKKYLFSQKNILKAIDDLDEGLNEGLLRASKDKR